MKFHRYGYRYLGDQYLPHVTVGRCDGPSGIPDGMLADFRTHFLGASFPAARLSFYRAGESGAFVEELATIDL